jgi:DivIVA domain-containing protein
LALERQDIEKRDFPVGRRGYDPDAVDRHLRRIADEVEALRAELEAVASRKGDSLAAAASDQVGAIVEAAEVSAEGIRQQAADEAREHVARVSEAASALLLRVDALNADVTQLQGSMGEFRAVAAGSGEALVVEEALEEDLAAVAAIPDPEPVEEKEPSVEEKEPTVEEKEPTVEEKAPEPVKERKPEPVKEKEPTVAEPSADTDSEGARLIALNMALNGTSREETDRYLAENFDLPDRNALLDDVYARVG